MANNMKYKKVNFFADGRLFFSVDEIDFIPKYYK